MVNPLVAFGWSNDDKTRAILGYRDEYAPMSLDVVVFGDGHSANGPEDSRIPIGSIDWNSLRNADWTRTVGTIHCDGKLRGSAVILDTSGLGPKPGGHVLLTAAHVLFDPTTEQLFNSCSFHFLGLNALQSYRAQIDLASAEIGGFSGHKNAASPMFGEEDWAVLHVPSQIPAVTSGLRPATFNSWRKLPKAVIDFRLLAWSDLHEAISISMNCAVQESQAKDIGGGLWAGQILDDCDSGQGASGGGLLAKLGNEWLLVGIRSGAHWDHLLFPEARPPEGPGSGVAWNVQSCTNFARAVDEEILAAIRVLIMRIGAASS